MKSYENKERGYVAHYLALDPKTRIRIYETKDTLCFIKPSKLKEKVIISAKRNRIQFYYLKNNRIFQLRIEQVATKILNTGKTGGTTFLQRRIRDKSAIYSIIKILLNFGEKHHIYFPKKLKRSHILVSDILFCLKYPVLASCYYGHYNKKGIKKYNHVENTKFYQSFKSSNLKRIRDFNHLFTWCFKYKSKKLKKLFISALQNKQYYKILNAWYFREILSLDYLYKIFEIECVLFEERTQKFKEKAIKLFSNYSSQRILLLLQTTDFYFLNDSINQYNEFIDKIILPKKPKTMRELHDEISRQYRRIKTPFQQLQQTDYFELDQQQVNDMTIRVAQDNHTLVEWGEIMHNCIASYKNSKSTLLGLYKNSELIYNLEIKSGKILQFRAKHNSNPEAKDKEIFNNFFNNFQQQLIKRKEENNYARVNSDDFIGCYC